MLLARFIEHHNRFHMHREGQACSNKQNAANTLRRRPRLAVADERNLLLLQGYETFESCFKSMTGRNILPYSTLDEGGTLMQWLSPLRR